MQQIDSTLTSEPRRRFASGIKPAPSLGVGTFPAYMYNVEDAEEIVGQYGVSLKLRYAVLLTSRSHPPRLMEITELASENAAVNSKLMDRVRAVNPGFEITAETDLGTIANLEGWVLVNVIRDPKDERYFAVKDTVPCPDGLRDQLPELLMGWDHKRGIDTLAIAGPVPSAPNVGVNPAIPETRDLDAIPHAEYVADEPPF